LPSAGFRQKVGMYELTLLGSEAGLKLGRALTRKTSVRVIAAV